MKRMILAIAVAVALIVLGIAAHAQTQTCNATLTQVNRTVTGMIQGCNYNVPASQPFTATMTYIWDAKTTRPVCHISATDVIRPRRFALRDS